MADSNQERWAERAIRDGVPARVIAHRLRNLGEADGRVWDLAEQAAAEAYLRAARRQFDSEGYYRGWLIQVGYRVAVDRHRHDSRIKYEEFPEHLRAREAEPLPGLPAGALDVLTAEERTIIHLSYEEGLTLDEIADRLLPPGDGSPNARRLRVKRKRDAALDKLREFLEDQ